MQTQPDQFRESEAQNETRPTYIYILKHTPFFGGATSYFLTCCDQDVVITSLPAAKGSNPQTFLSCQVGHSEIEQSSEQNSPQTSIQIGLNASPEAAELKKYFLTPIPNRIDVTIARVNSQVDPTDVDWEEDCYTVFRGVKMSVSLEGQLLIISAVNLMLQEDGRVPRYYYQKQCQHDFGGPFCGVNRETNQIRVATTIAALNRVNRTVDILATAMPNGDAITVTSFIGGRFAILDAPGGNKINEITISACEMLPAGAGTRLRLAWWDSSLDVASPVKVYRGCLHIVDACKEFNNIGNYGGTPYVPVNNPALDGINT